MSPSHGTPTDEGWADDPFGPAAAPTVPALVARAARDFGDREAVADGATRVGFAELGMRVSHAGRAIAAHGVRPGDRLAIWAPDSAEWIVTALGAMAAGAVLVPLDPGFDAAGARHALRTSRAKLILVPPGVSGDGEEYPSRVREIRADLPDLEAAAVFGTDIALAAAVPEGFHSLGITVPQSEFADLSVAVAPDSPGGLFFASGPAGLPEAVPAAHGRLLDAAARWSAAVGLGPHDRCLTVAPYSRAFAFRTGILACMMRGAAMVPSSVTGSVPIRADELLATVERERITVLSGSPSLLESLRSRPGLGERDLSSLRLVASEDAAVPAGDWLGGAHRTTRTRL